MIRDAHANSRLLCRLRAREFLHHCAWNAGLSVLKCQATDKPKALILRRGPHRNGGPWTLSRLIQLCYNPLPTRASSTPRHPSSIFQHPRLRSPASHCRGGRGEGLRKPNTRLFRILFTIAGIPWHTLRRNLPLPRAELLRSSQLGKIFQMRFAWI